MQKHTAVLFYKAATCTWAGWGSSASHHCLLAGSVVLAPLHLDSTIGRKEKNITYLMGLSVVRAQLE